MEKKSFKKSVLSFLAQNGFYPKKVRVYDSKKYGLEVRVYTAPMEYVSARTSFRTKNIKDLGDGKFQRNGTRGHHTIKIPMYIAINEAQMASTEERLFTLQCLKDSFSNTP